MHNFTYPATFSPEKGGAYTVTFPDLPEAITSGKDLPDALEQASDCLQEALAGRIVRRDPVPVPSKPKRGQRMIGVALYLAPKLALYMAMRNARVNNSELARRLGCTELVVRRMLNPKHDTKPEKLQAALEALGKRVLVVIDDAA
ncbi:MAG: type II toxin-antitoxin system HicB family antitoxin [Bryobacteraceae bacterium]|jgi:antitoxin HicB